MHFCSSTFAGLNVTEIRVVEPPFTIGISIFCQSENDPLLGAVSGGFSDFPPFDVGIVPEGAT